MSGAIEENTSVFSSRRPRLELPHRRLHREHATTCSMWFWITSRIAPVLLVQPPAALDAELSAMVICTLSTKFRFHSGSRKELAKRKYSRFCTGSLPR